MTATPQEIRCEILEQIKLAPTAEARAILIVGRGMISMMERLVLEVSKVGDRLAEVSVKMEEAAQVSEYRWKVQR